MSLTKVTNSMIQGAFINALDYGASPLGGLDASDQIQAAVDAAVLVGGTVFLPKGYYRVTKPINIGAPFYNDNNDVSFIVNATAPIDDAVDIAAQNATNKTANLTKKYIDFIGESGTYIVADFAPAFYQPVVAYNLDNDSFDPKGRIGNFAVIAADQVTDGVYDRNATYTANNLVGVYVGRGAAVSEGLMFAGLGCGLASMRSYWTAQKDMYAYHCGTGFALMGHNQASAQNMNAHTCLLGYKYTGQGAELTNFGTENCDNDIWIISADCCSFGPAYLEDVRDPSPASSYAVKVGYTANGTQITGSTFTNVLTLITDTVNKKSWRFWSFSASILNTCRFYGGGYDIDTASTGYTNGADPVTEFYNNSVQTLTYTPFLGDAFGHDVVYDTRAGVARKVGDLVTFSAVITWSSKGSVDASNLILSLPSATRNEPALLQYAAVWYTDGIPVVSPVSASALPNTAYLTLGNPSVIPANTISATGEIRISGTYIGQL